MKRSRNPLRGEQREYRPEIIAFMAAVHLLALIAIPFYSVPNLIAFLIMYVVTVFGVTLGLHRMASHKSFKSPRWFARILMTMGALAAQGGPIEWVGLHRHHHLYSDQEVDHHDSMRGFWWSHFEWMIHGVPAMKHIDTLTKDLQKDPYYRWLEEYFLLTQIPLGAILFLVGGWGMVLWGIPLRMAVVYNVTWLVNSATHTWGYRSYDTEDNSRNNWWVALLSFGEGWHNNHHAIQSRARHGLRWYEVDVTYYTIWILEKFGLARKVKHLRN